MKNEITEIYKVNGVTFTNYNYACEMIRKNNLRVTTTETTTHKGIKIHIMNVVSDER